MSLTKEEQSIINEAARQDPGFAAKLKSSGWKAVGKNANANAVVTGTITDFWIEYQPTLGDAYQRLTAGAKIPAGSPIRIRCTLNAHVSNGTKWAMCVTVLDTVTGLKNYAYHSTMYDYAGVGSADITGTFDCTTLGDNLVMPNVDMNLSAHLFAAMTDVPTPPSADMYY
jgi:hypothetical protein